MAGRFSQEFIDKVLDATDIVQTVSQHTRLTKKGTRYFGICPFHSEKTPSFSVNAEKQLYYCFGCSAGGNVVGFVMDVYKYSFPEAIEYLATQANIPIEYEEWNAKDDGLYQRKKRMHQINRDAARYYYAMFQKNKTAQAYINNRGLSKETIETFAIGYAPKRGGLYNYLKSKDYSEEEMLESSLVRKNERGFYDYFRDRIMFPIMDLSDNIVAFGGRILDKGEPKYLNSPETIVFYKHSMLYNLNRAKKELSTDPLIISEGYMDVISLYDKGVKNACATLGTALNKAHAKLILRYTNNTVLCYDGDRAGRAAAVRGADILQQEGLEPKILLLKDGEDPDSFIKKYGKDTFLEEVKQGVYPTDFKIDELAEQYDMKDIAQEARFLSEAIQIVRSMNDEIKWDHYAQKLAKMTYTNKDVIRNRIFNEQEPDDTSEKNKEETEENQTPDKLRGADLIQIRLLKYIMDTPEHYGFFTKAGGNESSFLNETYRDVFKQIESLYQKDKGIDIFKDFVYNNKVTPTVARINAETIDINKEEVAQYLQKLRIELYQNELKRLKRRIKDAERSDGTEDVKLLLKEYDFLQKKLKEIGRGGESNG